MLPEELIDGIVHLTSPSELLALCVADKRLHAICVPYIYDAVKIMHPEALVAFCEVVGSWPMLAKLVHRLKISFEEYSHSAPDAAQTNPLNQLQCRTTCATALGGLTKLLDFDIYGPMDLLPLLPPNSFPLLEAFASGFSKHIGPFLSAHTTIKHLQVGFLESIAHRRVQIPPVSLTVLETFYGPKVVARAVLPGSQVAAPAIIWETCALRDVCAEKCIMQLAQIQVPITELHNTMGGWDAPDPRRISEAMPNVEILRFENIRRDSSREHRETFLKALAAALPSFRSLGQIILEEQAQHPPLVDKTFDKEWALLQQWATLCPTLQDCTFLSGLRWHKSPDSGEWWPVNTVASTDCRKALGRWLRRAGLIPQKKDVEVAE
ncbi:hypothetical protein C8R43DRAFT_1173484 [Mycena crocata]|nr:hypothetical protein C8R43DRAFT_1173484 [Mycena crocata]